MQGTITVPDVLYILQDPLDCLQVVGYGRAVGGGSVGRHDCWNPPSLVRSLPQQIRTPRA